MKKALTGPDIGTLVSSWQVLLGSRIDQFGRPNENELVIKLRNSETGTVRLILDLKGWAYLTKKSISTESNQGGFVNKVRKIIKKGRLEAISQLNGDRIVCFDFIRGDDKCKLIVELFHKGNAVLCMDNEILTVMRQQKFRHRTLKTGEVYVSPPSFNPFNSDISVYSKTLLESERNLGASLTINCNLGGEISNLVCHNLKLDNDSKVIESDLASIYGEIKRILSDRIEPTIFVDDDDNNFTVSTYNLTNLKPSKTFLTFDEAIIEYLDSIKEPEIVVKDKEDYRIIKQREAIDGYLVKSLKLRKKGELVFSNIPLIQLAIDKTEDDEISIILDDIEVKINAHKSPETNGSMYFDNAKELERKAKRTEEVLLEKPKKIAKKKIIKQKMDWFEKYRWFITSEGEVAIGGKDATSNEQIVKKYLKSNDRYAHADIHGAPSVVVKNELGILPSSESMLEASRFSLAYSKAWGARVASGHSFWVNYDKVSKTPNTGEFLAKGAFVIRGKRNWNKNLEVELAIGLIKYKNTEKLMGGPLSSFENNSKKYILFKPGFNDRKQVSRKLAKKFNVELSTAEKLLPSGGFEVVKSVGLDFKLD